MPSVVEPLVLRVRRVAVVVRPLVPKSPPRFLEPLAVGGYLLALAYVLVRLAAVRLLWYDELFTLHLAGSPLSLWANLAAGVDLNPPLSYLLTALSVGVFGETAWAVRLPAVAGAVLGSLGLYLFVRHRRGPFEAFLAMSVLAASAPVWVYFYEARPYGLMVGFTALALVCWQRGRRVGFAAAVCLGLLSHYYFVVPLVAFGLAQLVRTAQDRKLDRGFALGLFAAALTLAALYPLWGFAKKGYAGGFWSKVRFNSGSVQDAFNGLYRKEVAIPVVLALAVGVLARRRDDGEPYPLAEAVAIAALAAGPVVGVAVGAKLTGGFFYRYVVPSMLGLAAVFAFAVGRAAGHRLAVAVAAAGFVWFGLIGMVNECVACYRNEARQYHDTAAFLAANADGLIVLESATDFTRFHHYHGDTLPLATIADADLAMKLAKADTVDRGLRALAGVTPLPPLPLLTPADVRAKLAAGELVFYFGTRTGWQPEELARRGVRFDPVATRENGTLFRLENVVVPE